MGGQGDCAPLLHRLVQKSLVRVEQEAQPQGTCTRYRLLRAIHEFASHQLAVGGEQTDVRRHHFDFCTQMATRLGNEVLGVRHRQAMAELDAVYHNIRAAIQFSLDKPELGEVRLRAAASLAFYWQLRSVTMSSEGIGWLAGIHVTEVDLSIATRAQAYTALLHLNGFDLFHWSSNFVTKSLETEALIEAADALVEPCLTQANWRTAAYLLLALAGAHRNHPELRANCREYTHRALKLMQRIEDPRGEGFARTELTALDVIQGQTQEIRSRQEEDFRLLEQAGSTWALCDAAALLDEATDLWRRRAGDRGEGSALQWSLIDRGRAALFLRRPRHGTPLL